MSKRSSTTTQTVKKPRPSTLDKTANKVAPKDPCPPAPKKTGLFAKPKFMIKEERIKPARFVRPDVAPEDPCPPAPKKDLCPPAPKKDLCPPAPKKDVPSTRFAEPGYVRIKPQVIAHSRVAPEDPCPPAPKKGDNVKITFTAVIEWIADNKDLLPQEETTNGEKNESSSSFAKAVKYRYT